MELQILSAGERAENTKVKNLLSIIYIGHVPCACIARPFACLHTSMVACSVKCNWFTPDQLFQGTSVNHACVYPKYTMALTSQSHGNDIPYVSEF